MLIATVSLNQIWEDKKANILLCTEYIKKASIENIDTIIFPEMTLTGFSTNISLTSEDDKKSDTVMQFKKLAKEFNIAIVFGVVIQNGSKALNRSVFIGKDGDILGKYNKIQPFSFSGEDKYFKAGNKLNIVKYDGFNIGLTICYDLRFPELYSALAKQCDIIINIANWPEKRVDHWNTLLKARAIENQLFIIGVNRTGKDGNGLSYQESSNIFNANGEVLEYNIFNDMKMYNIDKKFTQEFKDKFNTTNDRKIEFYKEII